MGNQCETLCGNESKNFTSDGPELPAPLPSVPSENEGDLDFNYLESYKIYKDKSGKIHVTAEFTP